MKILFVCTGNTCRSSMAEGIFNDMVRKSEQAGKHKKASSAGVAAYDGEPASKNAVTVLKEEWDIDISGHRSRSVRGASIEEADLVLTMSRGHKEHLIKMFPNARHKIYTLKQFALGMEPSPGEEYDYTLDISDPYGMSVKAYKKCAEEIREAIVKVLERLEGES